MEATPLEMVTVKTTLPTVPYPAIETRPSLKTGRLLLRPFTMADLEDVRVLRTQPEVMQWTARGTIDGDLDQTKAYIASKLPPHDATNYDWAICLAATGKVIGIGGIHRRKGELGWPELGYMFVKEAWGKGYATEFVRGLLPLWWALPRTEAEIEVDRATITGEGEIKVEHLIALTVSDNEASQKVLTKTGLEPVKIWEEPDLRDTTKMVMLHVYASKKPDVAVA